MKYLIFGNGWLGNRIKQYLGDKAIMYYGGIHDPDLGEVLKGDVWINTAAKTNIDWCEENKMKTLDTNVLGAVHLANLAKKYKKKYVFFSSACIFESKDREDVKYEDSIPNPACFYAETKAMAEKIILQENPDSLIVRPRLPISAIPHPRNTLNKLLKYDKLNTNQETVTVVEDMIPKLIYLIDRDEKGIFHLVNEGTISSAGLGDLLGHKHTKVDKKDQDKRLAKEGKAKRVTTYVGSRKIQPLPGIRGIAKNVTADFILRGGKRDAEHWQTDEDMEGKTIEYPEVYDRR